MDEPFPDIPDDVDIVFDLAGSMSASAVSIVSAIKQADLVIVPCWNNVHALTGMIGTLNEVRRFNQNILVIATKLQKRRVGRGYEQFAQWKDSVDCQNIMDTLKRVLERSSLTAEVLDRVRHDHRERAVHPPAHGKRPAGRTYLQGRG